MNLIAFDTTTPACSVALLAKQRIFTRYDVMPARHGEFLLAWFDEVLAAAGISRLQLTAISVTTGPGTFTGVRLGISVAQGLALGLNRPIIPLSSLHLLALQAPANAKAILACLDARMGEIYAGCFRRKDDGTLEPWGPERLCSPESLMLPESQHDWFALGSGLTVGQSLLHEQLKDRCLAQRPLATPDAKDMLGYAQHLFARGQLLKPEKIQATYLRQQVALTLAERRQGQSLKP